MTGISDNVLKAIQDSVETRIIDIDGVKYTTRQVADVRKPEPTPSALGINTLSGFVDYIVEAKHDPALIHISSHRDVHLISPIFGRFHQRHVYASATFIDLFGQGFTFNNFFDSETFIISLLTLFEDTPDKATILGAGEMLSAWIGTMLDFTWSDAIVGLLDAGTKYCHLQASTNFDQASGAIRFAETDRCSLHVQRAYKWLNRATLLKETARKMQQDEYRI